MLCFMSDLLSYRLLHGPLIYGLIINVGDFSFTVPLILFLQLLLLVDILHKLIIC